MTRPECPAEGQGARQPPESAVPVDCGREAPLLVMEALLIEENERLRCALETALHWCRVCGGEGVIAGTWRQESYLPCPACRKERLALRDLTEGDPAARPEGEA